MCFKLFWLIHTHIHTPKAAVSRVLTVNVCVNHRCKSYHICVSLFPCSVQCTVYHILTFCWYNPPTHVNICVCTACACLCFSYGKTTSTPVKRGFKRPPPPPLPNPFQNGKPCLLMLSFAHQRGSHMCCVLRWHEQVHC